MNTKVGVNDFGRALAEALGVDVSVGQNVKKIVLTIEPNEIPELVVTRLVLDEGSIGAVEKIMTKQMALQPLLSELSVDGLRSFVRLLEEEQALRKSIGKATGPHK